MGLIALEGLLFYAHHGYYKEEQMLGGKYVVDIYMEADLKDAAETDQLDKTINYEEVYRLVKTEMESHSKLLEHVGNRILVSLRKKYPTLASLKIRVSKHTPPLKGSVEAGFSSNWKGDFISSSYQSLSGPLPSPENHHGL